MNTSTKNLVGFVTMSLSVVMTLSLLSGTPNNMFGEYLGVMFLKILFTLFGEGLCWIVPVILFVAGLNVLKNDSVFSRKLVTILLFGFSAGLFLSIIDIALKSHLSCPLFTKIMSGLFGTHLFGAFVVSILFLGGVLVWKFQVNIVSLFGKFFKKEEKEEEFVPAVVVTSTVPKNDEDDFADRLNTMLKLKQIFAKTVDVIQKAGGVVPVNEVKRLEARMGELNIEIFDDKENKGTTLKEEVEKNKECIRRKLSELRAGCDITDVRVGPVVTWYGLRPVPGVRISSVCERIKKDLPVALGKEVRLTDDPSNFGIEVCNKDKDFVCIKDVFQMLEGPLAEDGKLKFVLGKDAAGNPVTPDLVQLTHLLVAGTTGSGKSVCISSLIASLIFSKSEDELKLILIDPKRGLNKFNGAPHLERPVVNDILDAVEVFQWAMDEMNKRYELLKGDDIFKYNEKNVVDKIPYIVIVVDEMAELILFGGKELEKKIISLAQKARAAGIFLVLATQRPDHNVITGLIKANIPARIALKVNDGRNSRIILDQENAEKLLGKGDMLFKDEVSQVLRVHGAFISDEEIVRLVEATKYATRTKV